MLILTGIVISLADPVVGGPVGIVVGVVFALSLLTGFTYLARRRAGPFFTDAQIQNNVEVRYHGRHLL